MKKILIFIGLMLIVSGCEYKPQKLIKLKAEDGSVVTLQCPEVEIGRNTFTYLIDNECRMIKE